MISVDLLVSFLGQRLHEPLPGPSSHEPLRATPIGNTLPNFDHKMPPKPGSVLILLYEEEGVVKFPLIKRPEYLGAHSGQISFPGGKAEPGETTIETALREGEEEIGIRASDIKVLGTLSTFFVIPSNFIVTPVVGFLSGTPNFHADTHEVARILQAELDDLLRPDAIKHREILAAGRFAMMAPHFEIDHEVVWGATAMMLNEFRSILLERDSK